MMEIQLQFILFACISMVTKFGLTSVRPTNQIKVQFQNLFDSIAKNNAEKSEIYHEILKQEVAKERQTFDAVKSELQTAQNRNAYRKRTLYIKSNVYENGSAIKRETNENDSTTETIIYNEYPPPTTPAATPREEQLENEYLLHYNGTDPNVQREWTIIRDLWFGEDLDGMKKFCAEFHEISGRGQLNVSTLIVQLNINFLRFRGTNLCEYARIDVLKYAENTTKITSDEVLFSRSEISFITDGLRSGCVYFLKPTDSTDMEFFLDTHVCKEDTLVANIKSAGINVTST